MADSDFDSVLITDRLFERSPRQPNLKAEVEVFRSLGQQLTQPTQTLLKHFTQIAKDLCQAGTAEISLIETTPAGQEYFRWVAVSGAYERYEGFTEPRHFSPCAVCLDRLAVQLFRIQSATTPA